MWVYPPKGTFFMICTIPKTHDQGVGISWVWVWVEWKVPRVLPMQLPNNRGGMSEIAHVQSSVYTTKKQFQGLRKCKFEFKRLAHLSDP